MPVSDSLAPSVGRPLVLGLLLCALGCGDDGSRPFGSPVGAQPTADAGETETTSGTATGAEPSDAFDSSGGGSSGGTPSDDASSNPDGSTGQAPSDTSGGDEVPSVPMDFNLIFRETVQACGGCGIWFDWQGVEENKPGLEVTWTLDGVQTTSVFRNGAGADGDAIGFHLRTEGVADPSQSLHSMLIKQSPARNALFQADLSEIPVDATIDEATLLLHIHTAEGLANSDNSSVIEVWECPVAWRWDEADWYQAAAGVPWATPGGDFGELIREIRAWEDLHALGYSKSNPDARFDFTPYVQQLQAER